MKTTLKLIGLVIILNVVRYTIAGPIEGFTIMEPMHLPMTEFPQCFNNQFTSLDWGTSFFYNFMVWFCATWVFYLVHPVISGHFILKSFKIYGLMCLFFVSITLVYMNHFVDGIRVFFAYAAVDALITFSVVALANGLLFTLFFKK